MYVYIYIYLYIYIHTYIYIIWRKEECELKKHMYICVYVMLK